MKEERCPCIGDNKSINTICIDLNHHIPIANCMVQTLWNQFKVLYGLLESIILYQLADLCASGSTKYIQKLRINSNWPIKWHNKL